MDTARKLLRKFKFKDIEQGVYELGCCANLQTIHSQQQRAFNLAWALIEKELATEDSEVAIIGGGISGLTMASALLAAGAKVTIFERTSDLLHLQHGSLTRSIHPNISKWRQDDGSGYPVTHLPFMNWRAGAAGVVNEELRFQWEIARTVFGKRLEVLENSKVASVSWNNISRNVDVRTTKATKPKKFSLAILAVGYGIETLDKSSTPSYWRNEDLGQLVLGSKNKKKVLVSGKGDGGLIEILRLKIQNFQQDSFFDEVMYEDWVKTAAERGRRLGWGKLWTDKAKTLKKKYPKFFSRVRKDTIVILNGRGDDPFDTNAQDLHLFFLSLLLAAKEVRYIPGCLEEVTKTPEGLKAKIKNRSRPLLVDSVVQRHGSDSALLEIFPTLDLDNLKDHWRKNDQAFPETHLPHYTRSFLADQLMNTHCEKEYEVGFCVRAESDVPILAERILSKLGEKEKHNLSNLHSVPIEKGCGGDKLYSLSFGKFELITFNGDDPQMNPGVTMSWRHYKPQEFQGLIFRTNSRVFLEKLLSGDEIPYHLLRVYLSKNFPSEHIDWLLNTDTGVFVVNFRNQTNCIEIHCSWGMYQAHSLMRFPIIRELLQNSWSLRLLQGIGWAVRNSYQTNRIAQRGNELLKR